jgi:hypothetical protein
MTCPLCNDTGEQRYWEGRWRTEKAENERLRAVLESLTKDPPATLAREPDEDWEVIVKMRAIAHAAIGATERKASPETRT